MSVRAIRMRYVMSVNTMSSSNLSSSSTSLTCNVTVVAVVLTCSVVTVMTLLTCTVAVVAQLTSVLVTFSIQFLSLQCLEITLTEEHKSMDPGETAPGIHAIPLIDPTHKILSASGTPIQLGWIEYKLQHGHQLPPVLRLQAKGS